jgi:hypothetical protein
MVEGKDDASPGPKRNVATSGGDYTNLGDGAQAGLAGVQN